LIVASLTAFAGIGCVTDQCATVCPDPAVPQMHPLGAVTRAHYEAMEANGEAADFVIHSGEFAANSPELTSAGRDHILEIGARMGGTPFPVIVERSESGSHLDTQRAQTVTDILANLGNPDAGQRVMVSRPYSDGIQAAEAIRR
jgi:hypothetical protein